MENILNEYLSVSESKDNINRQKKYPPIIVGIEEPISYIKLFGLDYNRFLNDAEYYIEKTLEFRLWRFNNIEDSFVLSNNIQASLGYYPEYTFFDLSLEFDEIGVPRIGENHKLRNCMDLSTLASVDFYRSGWMPKLINWHKEISKILSGKLNVGFQNWWRGPLDLSIQIRGYENVVIDASENKEFLHKLIQNITTQRINWYRDYYNYFNCSVSPTNIGDDWLNVPFISPDFFKDFVMPEYKRIENFHGKISSIHSCGNQTPIHSFMNELSSLDFFEISPWSNLNESLSIIPENKILSISFRPNFVLFDSDGTVKNKIEHIKRLTINRNILINTSGLSPINELSSEKNFLNQINQWLNIVKSILYEY